MASSPGPDRRAPQVVLADDDVLLREGVASLLDRSGFEVVGQAGNSSELLALARSARPELAIIDIRMRPGHTTEGLQATRGAGAVFTADVQLEYQLAGMCERQPASLLTDTGGDSVKGR